MLGYSVRRSTPTAFVEASVSFIIVIAAVLICCGLLGSTLVAPFIKDDPAMGIKTSYGIAGPEFVPTGTPQNLKVSDPKPRNIRFRPRQIA